MVCEKVGLLWIREHLQSEENTFTFNSHKAITNIRILPLPVPAGPYLEEEGAVDLVLLRPEDGGEVLGHREGGSLQI